MKTKIILAAFAVLPLLAQAVPVKMPECSKIRRINQPANATAAFFNEDCTTLYVLPPRVATFSVNGYRPSPNIAVQCERLKKIEQDSGALQDIILTYTERMKRYAKEIAEIEANLRDGLVPVGQTVETMEAKLDALVDKVAGVRTKIVTMQDQNDKSKLNFSRAEGGRGRFIMQSAFTELVDAYRRANPGLNVVEMPLDQSYLSINEVKREDKAEAIMPAILSLRSIGVEEMPLLLDPVLYLKNKELVPQKAPAGSKIFNGGLSGEIQLSNIGACAIQESLGPAERFQVSEVKSYIAASASYGYQVQVERKHSITYDFKELIHQLHEQSSKGGLFTSETMDRFIDDRSSSTWIQFNVSSNDTRYEYTDKYIEDVKREFLARALAQIVATQTGSQAAVLGLIAPGKNGASEAADQLQKCPDLTCQIGGAGFRVLNAIFGSANAVSELSKSMTGKMTEVVEEKKMVPAYGTYAFE